MIKQLSQKTRDLRQKIRESEERKKKLILKLKDLPLIEDFEDAHFRVQNLFQEKFTSCEDSYTFQNLISKASFEETIKATHKKNSTIRAVKIINKNLIGREFNPKEQVEFLKALDHPGISKMYEQYEDTSKIYIVSEFCSGGDLFDRIINEGKLNEQKAAQIILQILCAVNYLHSHNIIHRDLKPENIIFESSNSDFPLKIVGLESAVTWNSDQKLKQRIGTPYYIAPEVIQRKYDYQCDIWSCGVILYIMLCGFPPFNGSNNEKILEKVSIGKFDFDCQEWEQVSAEAKGLICKMLEKDPKKRVSLTEAAKDPWILKNTTTFYGDQQILRNCMSNLLNIRSQSKLQKAILMLLVHNFATQEEKLNLNKVFFAINTFKDGKIRREEILEAFKNVSIEGGQNISEKDISRIINDVGKNNSDSIDYTEWLMATINKEKLLSKENLVNAFNIFDKDRSGVISLIELREVLENNLLFSPNVWKELMNEIRYQIFDKISFNQFEKMMMNLIQN